MQMTMKMNWIERILSSDKYLELWWILSSEYWIITYKIYFLLHTHTICVEKRINYISYKSKHGAYIRYILPIHTAYLIDKNFGSGYPGDENCVKW